MLEWSERSSAELEVKLFAYTANASTPVRNVLQIYTKDAWGVHIMWAPILVARWFMTHPYPGMLKIVVRSKT